MGLLTVPSFKAHDFYYDYLWQSNGLNGSTELLSNNGGPGGAPEYSHDLFTRASEAFIRDNAPASEPFYLQMNYTIPHFSLSQIQSAPELVNLNGQTIYQGGLAQYGSMAGLTNAERQLGAMISRMDASIGSLIDRLRDPNGDGDFSDSILENTLILFTSDNGATPEGGLGQTSTASPKISGGLRGGKRDWYDGGIRMPAFAFWQGQIAAGSSTDLLNDLADFKATAAELAGTEARVGVDGVSILPTLLGTAGQRDREFLLFENFENSTMGFQRADWTILRDEMKLIRFSDGSYQLFNVVNDPTESNPLDLSLPANAQILSQLESLALADGAGQPNNYHVQFRDWSGADQGQVADSANWVVTNDPSATVGGVGNTWSALLRNTSNEDQTALVSQDINVLGFEVSGATAQQEVIVSSNRTLYGHNELRIGAKGKLQLNHAEVGSRRWVDI